eukprot:TRINITY_DN76463_c0_g1_i1.p1 TRINITY_DN76463_c0_g1~~TRINITY_DN76463_c0_g1_i1.p1  ORF type:complete len:307 (-),score=62.13 TRINITY_DN76463_c0_g1_i1:17-937(-)
MRLHFLPWTLTSPVIQHLRPRSAFALLEGYRALRPVGIPGCLTARSAHRKRGMVAGFRNPHNLPVKDCVVCGRPFTWRKKWERCWDEVLTCSNRCKTTRKQKPKSTQLLKEEEGVSSQSDSCDEEESRDVRRKEPAVAASAALAAAVATRQRKQCACVVEDRVEDEESEREEKARGSDASCLGSESEIEVDKKTARRQRKQALKAERRAKRAQSSEEAIAAKRKPCDLCSKPVDLLVRCTCDSSQQWRMLCGKCWKGASGGVPDGDADHPYYRYGGLWKNRAAKISTPKFPLSEQLAQEAEINSDH